MRRQRDSHSVRMDTPTSQASSKDLSDSQSSYSSKFGGKSRAQIQMRNCCGRIKNQFSTKKGCRQIGVIYHYIGSALLLLFFVCQIYQLYDSYYALLLFFGKSRGNDDVDWIQFGSYPGIPRFHVQKGRVDHEITSHLSIATICDLNTLNDTKTLITNYEGGPVSLAIYIDRDFREHSNKEADRLKALFDDEFGGIENEYELIISILYLNRSDPIWLSRDFRRSTPMMFKFPANSLRNLAESQVTTDWLFNCDIGFSYFPHSINHRTGNILQKLNEYTIDPQYGEKSIFIVPSFEVLTENRNIFNRLNKPDLLPLVENGDISPFDGNSQAQQCTKYDKWYNIKDDYLADYQNKTCVWSYEPLYIMKTETSRDEHYKWNSSYIGRGLSNVERTVTLRHYCFHFIILHDLFIIHPISNTLIDGAISDEENAKWNTFNLKLLEQQRNDYLLDEESCIHQKSQRNHSIGLYQWMMNNVANLKELYQDLSVGDAGDSDTDDSDDID